MKRREFLTAAGVAGGAGAAASGVAAQETSTPTGDGTPTGGGDGTATGTPSGGGQNFTWTIEMTDENVFIPDSIQVRPGDTIVWENVGSVGHTVTAYEEEIPEEAAYWASGGFDSEQAARDGYPDQGLLEGGETFEHTFETEGTHEYFCIPHEQVGMLGTVEVTPDAPTPTPTPAPVVREPPLPESAKAIGVAAAGAMASTLGLAYVFIKYGGGAPRE